MEQPRTPERLRELIDEALEEIERTELEMLDLLADVLGPDEVKRIADHIAAAERQERLRRLTPGASPGPSRSRPATP